MQATAKCSTNFCCVG